MLLFVFWDGGLGINFGFQDANISPAWGSGDESAAGAWDKLPETPHISCIPRSQTPHWKTGGHDCNSFLQESGVNTACFQMWFEDPVGCSITLL